MSGRELEPRTPKAKNYNSRFVNYNWSKFKHRQSKVVGSNPVQSLFKSRPKEGW